MHVIYPSFHRRQKGAVSIAQDACARYTQCITVVAYGIAHLGGDLVAGQRECEVGVLAADQVVVLRGSKGELSATGVRAEITVRQAGEMNPSAIIQADGRISFRTP